MSSSVRGLKVTFVIWWNVWTCSSWMMQTPVQTWWVLPESLFSVAIASSLSRGLPSGVESM